MAIEAACKPELLWAWMMGWLDGALPLKWIQKWKKWIACMAKKLFNSLTPHGEGREQNDYPKYRTMAKLR